MEGNNFKKLMEEDEERYLQHHHNQVGSRVWGTLGFFRLIGDLVTMFIPRVMDVFVMAAGGRGEDRGVSPERRGSLPPSLGQGIEPGKIAPGSPGDDDIR